MPYNLGMELKRDFPHLMRARYEKFGRGGGRGGGRGAPPAIPRSQCITNASAVDKARGEAAREREATAKAEERAEKTRQRLAASQLALFNSQEETDAALSDSKVWVEYASELEEALCVRVRPCETFEGVLEDVHRKLGRKLGRKRARRS